MKSGGDNSIGIRYVQLYVGNGASIAWDRSDATYRPALTGGITLGQKYRTPMVPLELHMERVANGVWAFGGDTAVRFLNSEGFGVSLGGKVDSLRGNGDPGLGITPFARLHWIYDSANFEGGALAYSGRDDVDAGRYYFMANVNVLVLAGAL